MSNSLQPHDFIRLCYRGVAAYADGMPVELLNAVHIATGLDREIKRAVSRGASVVLTGNPGDGKTHLLRVLETAIGKANSAAVVEYDASEVTNSDLVSRWKTAARKRSPFCVAVNEAVLKQLSDDNPTFEPVCIAQRQVEEALVYCRDGESPPKASDVDPVVFDLSRRNVLSEEIVKSVIRTFSTADRPTACKAETNDFALHASLIQEELFSARLLLLLKRTARRGFHCTLRELQGFISYLLCRGLDCDSLAAESGNADKFVAELVFRGEGDLFNHIRSGVDPSKVCHPVWDIRLIESDIPPQTWQGTQTELINACDVEDVSEVERRRRRFFFFNQNGHEYLDISDHADSQFDEFLTLKERDVLRLIVPRINRAFRDSTVEDLRVWKCHRFDHSDERTLCSLSSIARRSLEVLRPHLCESMRRAFEYMPDHLVVQLKGTPAARLVVDFPMFEFLKDTECGISILSTNNHVTRRLWRFMERLAAINVQHDGDVDVQMLDLESGHTLQVSVDLDDSQYLSVQGES